MLLLLQLVMLLRNSRHAYSHPIPMALLLEHLITFTAFVPQEALIGLDVMVQHVHGDVQHTKATQSIGATYCGPFL